MSFKIDNGTITLVDKAEMSILDYKKRRNFNFRR